MAEVAKQSNTTRVRDGDNAYLHIDYQESASTSVNCIRFIECLPIPSGALAGEGKLIKLLPWQKQMIRGIWPAKDQPRNEVLLCIARRNGKSVFLAGLITFLLFNTHAKSQPVPGSLMVSAACNREQASFIFDILALWCSTVIDLNHRSHVSHYYRTIELGNGIKYKAIAANARAALGGQYSAVICDEVGFWKDNSLQLALRSGMASTPPNKRLFLQASTVPNLPEHFFFDELDYFKNRKSTKTHYALVNITNPKTDPPDSEKTWIKSNPSYGVLVHKESFVSEYEAAKMFPQRLQGFCAYRCNSLLAAMSDNASKFVSRDVWNECEGKSELIKGEKIVVSWDAASTQDLTAIVAMSVDAPHRTDCHFIVPKAAVKKTPEIPYRLWAEQGYCELAETDYVSKQAVVNKYRHYLENYDVVASQSDLFGYPEILQISTQQGVSLDVHTARHTRDTDYNDGLEKLSELIKGKLILHDNPVLSYCIDNIRIKRKPSGAMVVDRKSSTKKGHKIDGGIAIMLLSLLVAGSTPVNSEINLEGLILQ